MREIYTPTTDEVRESYANILISTGPNTFELIDPDKAHAEFDKWLFAERQRVADLAIAKERKHMVQILMSEHSHDPGLCGDVADYTNNGVYSDECLYLQRIYGKMNEE